MRIKTNLLVLILILWVPLASNAKCSNYLGNQKAFSEIFNTFDISTNSRLEGRCDMSEYLKLLGNIYTVTDEAIYLYGVNEGSDFPEKELVATYNQIFGKKERFGSLRNEIGYENDYTDFIFKYYNKNIKNVEVGKTIPLSAIFKLHGINYRKVKDREFQVVEMQLNCTILNCEELKLNIRKDKKNFQNKLFDLTEVNQKLLAEEENKRKELILKMQKTEIMRNELKTELLNKAKYNTVTKVLNYSSGLPDDGLKDKFWYTLDEKSCTYKLTLNGFETEKEINLNSYDPRSIKFQTTVKGETYVLYDGKYLTTNAYGADSKTVMLQNFVALDHERLERGWNLIYSKFCKGKLREF